MPLTNNEPSIQMTLFDYFMDQDQFTINDAIEAVKQVKAVKEPSVRARIYEGIDKGYFERIGKGVYTVKRVNEQGKEQTCMLINGNGRDLSFIEDNSIDCIITDHPYDLTKSLKGGNRNFAEYERFTYTESDFREKQRVLKPGCFLVEFLPEENGDNYKYLFKVKEMAAKVGMEYYATVPWKKGDFVANTGRKSKNTEQVVFFTKGKCRDLRLDAKKNKAMIEDMCVLHFERERESLFDETTVIEYKLLIKSSEYDVVEKELNNAFENWQYFDCVDSILKDDYPDVSFEQIPVGDYMLMWLDKLGLSYIDITGKFEDVDYGLPSEAAFIEKVISILKEVAPDRLYYMSGAQGMLPTQFDVQPPSKNERIHQAEKPVELLEQIIRFVTKEDELILDQFAGSGSLGEAAINEKRNSILIESDEQIYERMAERIHKLEEEDSVEYLRVLAGSLHEKNNGSTSLSDKDKYIATCEERAKECGLNIVIAELKDELAKLDRMQLTEERGIMQEKTIE